MRALLALALATAAGACLPPGDARDPIETAGTRDVGRPVLSYLWSHEVADRAQHHRPQEFAQPAAAPLGRSGDRRAVYIGSTGGRLYALRARDGKVLWSARTGPVSSEPLVAGRMVYVGTDDGKLLAFDQATGKERWSYQAKGAIVRPPVASGDSIFFATELDTVIALDRDTGKWRWQYERDTPEEFTLRGNAGITLAGDLLISGFADGNVVALSASGGESRWIKSLTAGKTQFVDIDTTPVVLGDTVYAASGAAGLYALDVTTGQERWRLALEGITQLTLEGDRLYVAAADQGLAAIDLSGRLLWRQGFARAGEPSRPVVEGNMMMVAVADRGLYIVDKRTGRLLQYFDPGPGVSAAPAVDDGRVYVMSNGAILYAFLLNQF